MLSIFSHACSIHFLRSGIIQKLEQDIYTPLNIKDKYVPGFLSNIKNYIKENQSLIFNFFQEQLVLIISQSCSFICLLKFIWNPRVNTLSTLKAIHRHAQSGKNFSCPQVTFPAEMDQNYALPSCCSFQTETRPFWCLFSFALPFSHLCAFCWWFCCLMWPKRTMLSAIPNHKKLVKSLVKKPCVRKASLRH